MVLSVPDIPAITLKSKAKQEASDKVAKINLQPVVDDYVQELRQLGVVISTGMTSDGKLLYLLAVSKDGIPFVMFLDLLEYQRHLDSSGKRFSVVKLENQGRSNVEELLPQEVKIGALKCTELGVSGAVFINRGQVCFTKKKIGYPDDELRYTEEIFTVDGLPNSICGIPLVNMSSVLHEKECLVKVKSASERLNQIYRQRLCTVLMDFDNTLARLTEQKTGLTNFLNILYEPFRQQIETQEAMLKTLPSGSENYQQLLQRIAQMREIRFRALEKISHLELHYQQIATISSQISAELDPVVGEVLTLLNN